MYFFMSGRATTASSMPCLSSSASTSAEFNAFTSSWFQRVSTDGGVFDPLQGAGTVHVEESSCVGTPPCVAAGCEGYWRSMHVHAMRKLFFVIAVLAIVGVAPAFAQAANIGDDRSR